MEHIKYKSLNQPVKAVLFGITLFLCSEAQSAGNPTSQNKNQFVYGGEFTRTNARIISHTVFSILKKVIFNRGEGVLFVNLPPSIRTQEKYLTLLRAECPECKITEIRDSHGEVSYKINYPDDFYIISSLDAGALEWQSEPFAISDLKKEASRFQKDVFSLSEQAGASRRFNGNGGHDTFSGFGGDSFWYGNYLKFRANLTFLDWGFFGKDGYNAMPVRRWALEQQEKYAQIHQAHDRQWGNFLRKLETRLDATASTESLMTLFNERRVMNIPEYASALFDIYSNPKYEIPRLGMRTKKKYVANRPDPRERIENRAIAPQKNANQFVKTSAFIDAELWTIKGKMDEGKQVQFRVRQEPKPTYSAHEASRLAKATTKFLGLDWNDYQEFGRSVSEPTDATFIEEYFEDQAYGAKKRDELYERVFQQFLEKPELNPREVSFLLSLANEKSYTIDNLNANIQAVLKKINPNAFQLSHGDVILSMINKFKYGKKDRMVAFSQPLSRLLELGITQRNSVFLRKLFTVLSPEQYLRLHEEVKTWHLNTNHEIDLYAELILKNEKFEEAASWLKLQSEAGSFRSSPYLSPHFSTLLLAVDPEVAKKIMTPYKNQWILFRKITDPSLELSVVALAELFPNERDLILKPYIRGLTRKLKQHRYGESDGFYDTLGYAKKVAEYLPPSTRQDYLASLLAEAKRNQPLDPNVERPRLIEFLQEEVRRSTQNITVICSEKLH